MWRSTKVPYSVDISGTLVVPTFTHHAVTAIGPAAASLVRDDLERGAAGRGSALRRQARAARWEGAIIGCERVTHESNSTVHVGEDYGGGDRWVRDRKHFISPTNPRQIEKCSEGREIRRKGSRETGLETAVCALRVMVKAHGRFAGGESCGCQRVTAQLRARAMPTARLSCDVVDSEEAELRRVYSSDPRCRC